MPIYEYKCDGCDEVFEVFQKVSDPPPAQHGCGSTQVHRVLSNTSFVLKGTGWYITDYGRKDSGGEAAKKKGGGDKGDGGASGGDGKASDSKTSSGSGSSSPKGSAS